MAFPVPLVSALTGASKGQLATWRQGADPILVPEVSQRPQSLYSFRDMVALRTVVKLRSRVPLQRIRKAFRSLADYDLTDHPSRYTLVTDGFSVFLVEGEEATDLVLKPGQKVLTGLDDVFRQFTNLQNHTVVDFMNPRPHLEVRESRMGGWPTIRGTRVPYDTVADLVGDGTITADQVPHFFPTVTPSDVPDAVDFEQQVHSKYPTDSGVVA